MAMRSVERTAHAGEPGHAIGGEIRHAGSRSGFTLVELLVVIMILGMLAALVTTASVRAMASARNARIKAEIDMLHTALMNYKGEYGSLPPGFDNTLSSASAAGKHLARLFPRCSAANVPTQLATAFASATPSYVTGTNAISFWLSGYTTDPTSPLLPLTSRKRLFDFDQSRVNQSSGAFYPSSKPGSPYVYIDSTLYSSLPYPGGSSSTIGAFRITYKGDPTPFANTSQEFANPDTFQILCAGSDETFGTDDDLSNFWPATRKEYLDSLK